MNLLVHKARDAAQKSGMGEGATWETFFSMPNSSVLSVLNFKVFGFLKKLDSSVLQSEDGVAS